MLTALLSKVADINYINQVITQYIAPTIDTYITNDEKTKEYLPALQEYTDRNEYKIT